MLLAPCRFQHPSFQCCIPVKDNNHSHHQRTCTLLGRLVHRTFLDLITPSTHMVISTRHTTHKPMDNILWRSRSEMVCLLATYPHPCFRLVTQ